jgi:hypothetical protein
VNRRTFLKLTASLPAASLLLNPEEVLGFVYPFTEEKKELSTDVCRLQDGQTLYNSEYFKKIKEFNRSFKDDIVASPAEFALITSCNTKLRELMKFVGFGNFNILSYRDALKTMSLRGSLAEFTPQEKGFMEDFFRRSASVYGFYGDRIFNSLYDEVNEKHVFKVPGTGHYIYKGKAEGTYAKITSDMKTLILTSGVRSVVKQAGLFLAKIVDTKGNISMASRSIAPIGYSFHGTGDFDVGIKGWGHFNFTDRFATTREYSRLLEEGYMRIRYDRKNPYGVRFEPWHVKVV